MVPETGAMRMTALLMNKNAVFKDLPYWNYRATYENSDYVTDPVEANSRKYKLKGEVGKTTRALISLLDMGVHVADPMIERLVKYYIVLLDADEYNLNFEMAFDDIFEM